MGQSTSTGVLCPTSRSPDPRTHLERGQREEELAVEAAGAAQRRVDRVDAVRRADDDHLAAVVEPVHEREQRRHERAVDLVLLARAHRRQAVDLVEEDNGGAHLVRLQRHEKHVTQAVHNWIVCIQPRHRTLSSSSGICGWFGSFASVKVVFT